VPVMPLLHLDVQTYGKGTVENPNGPVAQCARPAYDARTRSEDWSFDAVL